MRFETGSLVTARDREWIVQAESTPELLILKPVGGTSKETTGIYLPLEPEVKLSKFPLPIPEDIGDFNSAQLLRDAVALSFRSTAGPFRSFGKLAFRPRPYQLVPLILALRKDPVRILIADDVGIGKTIEACLIAKELIERREASRLCVLCPPHLVEQWHEELKTKFNIDAQTVLPSTVHKLERHCAYNESVFDVCPNVVVSIDFIKSDRRRADFVRACPKLVIIDEAHTVGYGGQLNSSQHQRHELAKRLSQDKNRHLILVTATPHSGQEIAFRSLLKLLTEEFSNLPNDLSGDENRKSRELVSAYYVQRKRPDIEKYLGTDTHFPQRKSREEPYLLSQDYKTLFSKVLDFTREFVSIDGIKTHKQRVRWWSAISLLRALSSSPAAALATLRARASTAETTTIETADEIGRIETFDSEATDESAIDQTPGADIGEEISSKKLNSFADFASKLFSSQLDLKLAKVEEVVRELLKENFSPIIFCRFIATAPYVAEHLLKVIGAKVQVQYVSGEKTSSEREEIVSSFDTNKPRVLVATDCLSEGINLQHYFDSVIHYDLAWNPTRHEQREGRVDRFGQQSKEVRVVTIYGIDTQIDGIVLEVLLKKQKSIRNDLGISVPIPVDADSVVEAIFEGLLLRQETEVQGNQTLLPGFDEYFKPKKEDLHKQWDIAADREKASRRLFAQHSIKVEEVLQELKALESATGDSRLQDFIYSAAKACSVKIKEPRAQSIELDFTDSPIALRDSLPERKKYLLSFNEESGDSTEVLHRTHPITEALSNYLFNSALDNSQESPARRCGVIRTEVVNKRTTLLLLRLRFQISFVADNQPQNILAENCSSLVFEGSPSEPIWQDNNELVEALYQACPRQNVAPQQAKEFIAKVISAYPTLHPVIEEHAKAEACDLMESHQRVRKALLEKLGRSLQVTALPADILGIYIYIPVLDL